MSLRKNLRESRAKQNMTQKQVAEYLGISERGYKFIEYGDRLGSIDVWDRLEDLFKVHQRILRKNFGTGDNQQILPEYLPSLKEIPN